MKTTETTFRDEDGEWVRRCPKCTRVALLSKGFRRNRHEPRGDNQDYDRICTHCRDGLPRLPAPPLADLIDRRLDELVREHDGRYGLRDLATRLDFQPKSFYAWKSGERATVRWDTADRVLVRAGVNMFEIWPEDEYPHLYE